MHIKYSCQVIFYTCFRRPDISRLIIRKRCISYQFTVTTRAAFRSVSYSVSACAFRRAAPIFFTVSLSTMAGFISIWVEFLLLLRMRSSST